MAAFGLANGIYKAAAMSLPSRTAVFLRGIFVSIILLCAVLLALGSTAFLLEYIAMMACVSLIGYLALLLLTKALSEGDVGVVIPISNSSVLFTVLFSLIFFGETLSLVQILGVAAIVIGIFLVSGNPLSMLKKGSVLAKGAALAFVVCVLWGALFFLLKIPALAIGPVLTSFLLEFFQMAFAGMHMKIGKEPFRMPNMKIMKYIIASAVLIAIAGLAYNFGIASGNVSIVAPISMSSPFIAALYGKFVYKEKLVFWQYIGIIAVIAGNTLISA
jgi:uncharacterized membrane protein